MISLFVHACEPHTLPTANEYKLIVVAKILWSLYQQRKEMTKFLDNDESTHCNNFIQPLLLSLVVLLPVIISIPIYIALTVGATQGSKSSFLFWPGWTIIHADWEPNIFPTSLWNSNGYSTIFSLRYGKWVNPIYAFLLFVIYGLAEGARQRYLSIFWAVLILCGVRQKPPETNTVSAIVFHSTPQLSCEV